MGRLCQVLEILGQELIVLLTAALPVVELRGAIPVGLSLGMSPLHAVLLSLLGSMIPVPFILFGVRPVFKYLRGTELFRKFVGSLTDRALNSHGDKVQKYGAAALLDIRFRWAFPAILLGNMIAAAAVLWMSYGFFS